MRGGRRDQSENVHNDAATSPSYQVGQRAEKPVRATDVYTAIVHHRRDSFLLLDRPKNSDCCVVVVPSTQCDSRGQDAPWSLVAVDIESATDTAANGARGPLHFGEDEQAVPRVATGACFANMVPIGEGTDMVFF